MDRILGYILSVVGTALIVSLANTLVDNSGPVGSAIKLLTGIVLTTVIVSPWTELNVNEFYDIFNDINVSADKVAQDGEQLAHSEILSHIKENTEAYILDRAADLGLNITAEISFDANSPYTPHSVIITGTASPYIKKRLMDIIQDELNIARENQTWS